MVDKAPRGGLGDNIISVTVSSNDDKVNCQRNLEYKADSNDSTLPEWRREANHQD